MAIQGINNNMPQLQTAQKDLQMWIKELGSGKKSFQTTSPATLMIGQRLLNNAAGTSMANMNVNFANSRSQTVESYLGNASDVTSRLKELSVQAANGMLTDNDREAINAEAQELLEHMDETFRNANFNGQKILQGGSESVAVSSDGSSLEIHNGDLSRATLGLEGFDLSTQEGANAALEAADGAIDALGSQRAQIGSDIRILDERFDANMDYEAALREAGSRQVDVDYAFGATQQASASIQAQVATAVSAQGNQLAGSMISGLV
ncbi:hypothetical protein BVY04_00300 [bacterium M21]|nr:hypothetical protein BVY04_00300 [bacterium M21]